MESKGVSVVLLSWNRREDVLEVLGELRKVTYAPLEIIVVDNASTDGTAERVIELFPDVILLRMSGNLGIAGYNAGFERASGEYIVILDDDSFPNPDAIELMVARFEADPGLGVVAFDVRHAARRGGAAHPVAGEVSPGYQMSFNGAGVGIRSALFRRVGWYPAEFFLYWNEQDTAFRILDAGYRIGTFPEIVAWHKSSPRNRTSERAPFYYTRNAFWLVWKNYPADMAVAATLALCMQCLSHSIEQRTSVYLRALWSAFRDCRVLRGLRKPVDREIVRRARPVFASAFTQFR